MHLTNYSINRRSETFVQNKVEDDGEEAGHKRSIVWLKKKLEKDGHDTDKLWRKMNKLIIKTCCVG